MLRSHSPDGLEPSKKDPPALKQIWGCNVSSYWVQHNVDDWLVGCLAEHLLNNVVLMQCSPKWSWRSYSNQETEQGVEHNTALIAHHLVCGQRVNVLHKKHKIHTAPAAYFILKAILLTVFLAAAAIRLYWLYRWWPDFWCFSSWWWLQACGAQYSLILR